MISISPFRFDKNTVIIDPEILVYDVFKKVYDLDKSTNKELALKYFTYIYHSADQRVIPMLKGYGTKETHLYACKEAKLDSKFNVPREVSEAIIFYRDNFISPIKELSLKLLNTLQKNVKILSKIDTLLDRKLDQDSITAEQIAELLSLQKNVTLIISQLPSQIKSLREIDIELTTEDKTGKTLLRGGNNIASSMTRNNEIED